MARLTPAATVSAVQRQTRKNSTQKKYKVVFESVTSKQKKLHTVIKFGAKPPPGYTFIPAGIPELTQRCKNDSRAGNHKIFVVSTSRTVTNQITQHVNRIGYHFVSSVAEQACRALGLNVHTLRPHLFNDRQLKNNGFRRGAPTTADSTPQEVLDAQAHDHLNDLFPGAPDEDKLLIITRAFKKGDQTVGNVAELSVARRVQLAVVAHIRHVHTDYDKLLRSHGYLGAREMVHKGCVKKLLEWRGDEEGEDEVNEFFREVIYIPDSDEEDDDDGGEEDENEEDHHASDSEASVEIIAVQTVARELHDHEPGQGKGADGADGVPGKSGAVDDNHDQPYIQDQSSPNRRIYATRAAVPTARQPHRRDDRRRRWKNRRDLQRYDAIRETQEKATVNSGQPPPTQQAKTPVQRDGVVDLISPQRDFRQQHNGFQDSTRPSAIQGDLVRYSSGWPVDAGTSREGPPMGDPGAALISDRVLRSRTVMANVSPYRTDDGRHGPTSGIPFSPARRLQWIPQSAIPSPTSVQPPYTPSSKPQHPNACKEPRRLLIPADSESLRNSAAPSRQLRGVVAPHPRSAENGRGVVMPSIESPLDGLSPRPYRPSLDESQSLEVLPNGRGREALQTAAVNSSQRLVEARFDESHQVPGDPQRNYLSTLPIRERPDGRSYSRYGETEVMMEHRREPPASSLGRTEVTRAPSAALQSSVGPHMRLVPVSPDTERFVLSRSREAPPDLVRSSMSHRDFFDDLSSRDARAEAARARLSGDHVPVSREPGHLRYESVGEPRATQLFYSSGGPRPRGDDSFYPEGAPEQSVRYPAASRELPILGLDRATVARDRDTAPHRRLVPLRGHIPDPLLGRNPTHRVPVGMPAPKRPAYRSSDHFGPGTEGYRPSDRETRPDPAERHHEMFYATSAGVSSSRRMSYPDYMVARDLNDRLSSVRMGEPQGKMPHLVRELSPVPDRRRYMENGPLSSPDPHRVRQYSLVYDDDATRRLSRAPYSEKGAENVGGRAPRPSDEVIVLE